MKDDMYNDICFARPDGWPTDEYFVDDFKFEPKDSYTIYKMPCPVCGAEIGLHPQKPLFIKRNDYDLQREKSFGYPFDFTSGGVVVPFVCENGCEFSLVLSNHDGTLFGKYTRTHEQKYQIEEVSPLLVNERQITKSQYYLIMRIGESLSIDTPLTYFGAYLKWYDLPVSSRFASDFIDKYIYEYERKKAEQRIGRHKNSNVIRDVAVYRHVSPSGKAYIGITAKSLTDRFGKNGNNYSSQPFYSAIKKYGWENFTHEVFNRTHNGEELWCSIDLSESEIASNPDSVFHNFSLADAQDLEIWFIKEARDGLGCYNATNGGDFTMLEDEDDLRLYFELRVNDGEGYAVPAE